MLTKIKRDNMAKKGFKLPGVSPLKQTGSTNGQFFQPLNPRSYGSGSGGSYANPMSYDAYMPTSSIGGASTIESLGDTFSSITKSLSNDSEDSDTSDNVSGSDITINSLGQIPLEKPAIEVERGTDPRLQQRIQDAESAGNLKKAARLQGKQDRNIVRQVEGAKRIEQRQSDRTEKTRKRQEEKTTPLQMKNDSPNKFLGGITAGIAGGSRGFGGGQVDFQGLGGGGGVLSRLAKAQLSQNAGPTQAQQAAAASVAAGGTMGTAAQDPMTGGAASINSGVLPNLAGAGQAGGGASGGQTLNCTPIAMSYDPPLQANEKGGKKSVFNMNTKGMAETAFGTPAMMQKSVGVAYMTESQEEAFGPGGHSENPGLYKQLK